MLISLNKLSWFYKKKKNAKASQGLCTFRDGPPPAKWRRYFLSNVPPSIHPFFHPKVHQMNFNTKHMKLQQF
jgi:hypothetical protein